MDRGGRRARDDIPDATSRGRCWWRGRRRPWPRWRRRRRCRGCGRWRGRRRWRCGRRGGGAAGAAGAGRGSAAADPEAQPQRGGRGNAAPPRPTDAHVLKFSRTGQFLLQIGKAGQPGAKDSQTGLDRPADVAVDSAANEVYVADGGENQRIVVFDADTGAFKRQWSGTRHRVRPPELRRAREGRHGLRLRSQEQSHPGVQEGRHVRQGRRRLEGDDDGTGRCGTSRSRTTRSSGTCSSPTVRTRRSSSLDRDTLDTRRQLRRRRRLARARSTRVGSVGVDSKGNLYTGETLRRQARPEVRARSSGGTGAMRQHPRLDPVAFVAAARGARARRARARAHGCSRRRRAISSTRREFEVDPTFPKPLPNHWLLGADDRRRRRRAGSRLDRPSRRSASCPARRGARPESADRDVLLEGAADPRVRSGRQPRRATGAARARATSGRRRTTASRSTTRATSGSAATAATDRSILKFTQDGKFVAQFGQLGQEHGQQRHRELRPARRSSSTEDQRGVHRRRLRQQARGRDRRRHRQVQALLGRVRQQAGRHRTSAATIRTRRRSSSSAARCTAPSCRTTASSTSATARTIASRSSREDGKFVKEVVHRDEDARRRLGVGHRVLEGSAAEVPVPRRRQEREDLHHAARHRSRS